MHLLSRRRFISTASAMAAGCAADLSFLAPLGRAAASDIIIKPQHVIFGPETDRLLELIRSTPREQCVPIFVKEIKAGLSYRQFLTALFLAAVENGDPHQVAQVYAAHRVSTDARIEERLLPLFWVLNRIKAEHDPAAVTNPAVQSFKGQLPAAGAAPDIFWQALRRSDSREAERAALALARDRGPRHVLHQLWQFAPRNLGGNLGHPAIALANSLRALDAIGWQHAEVALRYVTRYIAGYKGDKTYATATQRVEQMSARLPVDWTSASAEKSATVALYKLLRTGNAEQSCDFISSELLSGKVKAGAIWDAIILAAADSIFRHKIGGGMLGAQIHAVTTTNALRFGFDATDDPRTKLIILLQAAGVIADFYVRHVSGEGNLRNLSLLDLKRSPGNITGTMRDVFESLPFKARDHFEPKPGEREASDQASQLVFDLLGDDTQQAAFIRTARSFLCVKASIDPHDIKFPIAAFEEAHNASTEWRPYILAASVHALHGAKSHDTAVLLQVRDALN